MTENSRKVFDFLKDNYGEKLVHSQIAEALGVSSPAVTGSVNGLVKKGYAIRNEETVMDENGKATTIKYISLTEEGFAFDPDAEVKKD
jgi:DNA-binding MarR family transcriptional regulator